MHATGLGASGEAFSNALGPVVQAQPPQPPESNLAADPDFESSPFSAYFSNGPGTFSWASDEAR